MNEVIESNPIEYVKFNKWEFVTCKLVFFHQNQTVESGKLSVKELENLLTENSVDYSKSQISNREKNLVRFTANTLKTGEVNNTYPNEIAIIIQEN